jgi:tetratricopeptide (TPR) repeat protein
MSEGVKYNEKAFLELAYQLSDDSDTFPGTQTPYMCKILKKALEIDSKGNIENSFAIDLIVQDLISEAYSKNKQTDIDYKKEQPSLLKGMILALVNQYDAAQIHFDKATQIEPNSIMAWYGKAISLKQRGTPEEALDALDIALKLDPENEIVLMAKARSLDSIGKIDQSIDLLFKAKKILSAKSTYYSLLGILYIKKENYSQARNNIKAGICIEPKSCWLWLLKAFSYVFEGKYDQAFEPCKYALKFDSNYWPAIYFIGLLNDILKKHDEALFYFERAAEQAPEILEISLSKIRLLRTLNKIDEACDECENLLKKNMKYAPAWEEKAHLLILKKDWDKAIEVCQLGRETCGDNAEFWKYMGAAYDNLGKFNCSIECYNKVLPYKPEDATAWFNKGSVLLKATVVDKNDLFRREKRIKEALECGKRAVEIDEKFGLGWYIYGLAHFQSGDMSKGLLLLEKAAKMGSFEAQLLYQLLKANNTGEIS